MIADLTIKPRAQSLYLNANIPIREIARRFRIGRGTVGRWIAEVTTPERRRAARCKPRGSRKKNFVVAPPKPKPIVQSLPLEEQVAEFIRTKGITYVTPEMVGQRLDRYLKNNVPMFKYRGNRNAGF